MMDDGLISESIMKMWKRPKTKYKRLSQLRNHLKC